MQGGLFEMDRLSLSCHYTDIMNRRSPRPKDVRGLDGLIHGLRRKFEIRNIGVDGL